MFLNFCGNPVLLSTHNIRFDSKLIKKDISFVTHLSGGLSTALRMAKIPKALASLSAIDTE